MDNALASKDALRLSLGVTLTRQQVGALTHDIVWMENRVVDGQTVLMPVLYLAQAESRNVRGNSLIQGRDLNLFTGGDLINVGTLRASNNLSATAAGSLYNGGLIEAGNNLTLLAQDSIRNAMAGEIRGKQVSMAAVRGDITNDNTAIQVRDGAGMRTLTDNGSSLIVARENLAMNAGRDLITRGALTGGTDVTLTAGRDISLLPVSDTSVKHTFSDGGHKSSITTDVKNRAATVTAGGNLNMKAGQDVNIIGSNATAGKDFNVDAGRDFNVASVSDVHNVEGKEKHGKKRIKTADEQTTQVASVLTAGGNFTSQAGRDTTLVASRISAGNEAYLYSGDKLNLLAAQNSTHTLYDMKENGGWGAKKAKRDEVTQTTNVGTEIKTAGNLTLVSNGDQRYQVAKLNSGNDLILKSGGAITFEGVKDYHDESHTKSKSNMAWFSMKGKGKTDETLRQSELVAQGQTVIQAVNGLKIDVKQVDQQTVSQTIDAMVKADPQLAWLKEAEKRGDVDWRQVKELHDSFKYSNSGLGAGAQIIIAIIVTYFTMGAASGAIAAAGTGTSMAGATAAATATSAAGWANAAGSVVLGGMASNGAISTINNRGNLSAVFKDVTSSDAMRGYVVSGVTAGLTAGFYDDWTSTQTGTTTALPNSGVVTSASPLSTWQGVGQFTANQVLQNGTSAILTKALGGEASLGDALQSSLANAFAAYGFNMIGDVSKNRFADGGITKIGLHALMGGLAAEAAGGDFRTGALAAGVNEALVDSLAKQYASMPEDKRKGLLVMSSQLIGVLAASVDSDADGKSLQTGAWVAGNATQYNWLLHGEIEAADKAREGCNARGGDVAGCKRSITQAMDSLDKARNMERADQIRQVDLANYQEGMTPGEYKDALDSYWNGIDKNELVWTGYEPAHELGYIAGEMGSGFVKRAVDWPGKVYDTITHLTDIPANLLQAGKDGVNWINSPIPAQSLERAGDELIFATPDKLGGIVFDAATGAITAGVGGKAVEWIGGRWTLRSSANTLPSKPIEFSGGTPTLEGTSFSPDIVNLRSAEFYALYGDNPLRGAKGIQATEAALQVPGRVQSRVNLRNGSQAEGAGWNHLTNEHYSAVKNKSQFTVPQDELRQILQSKEVVSTPVTKVLPSADGPRFVREVDVGKNIGTDKFNNFSPTTKMSVLTDEAGNLVSAFPGVLK